MSNPFTLLPPPNLSLLTFSYETLLSKQEKKEKNKYSLFTALEKLPSQKTCINDENFLYFTPIKVGNVVIQVFTRETNDQFFSLKAYCIGEINPATLVFDNVIIYKESSDKESEDPIKMLEKEITLRHQGFFA